MRNLKGNGGKVGGQIRYQSVADGGGCLKHNCSDCMRCPLPNGKCDYCYSTECILKRRKLLGGTLALTDATG